MTGTFGCCARAASGHATAAPPSAASNSRRPMVTVIRPSRARCVKGTIPHQERAVFIFKEDRIAVASPLSHCPKQTFGLRLQSTDREDRPFYSITLSLQHPRFAERRLWNIDSGATSLPLDVECPDDVALVGSTSTAIREAAGTSSRSSSSRFAANSAAKKLTPVRLPPGRDAIRRGALEKMMLEEQVPLPKLVLEHEGIELSEPADIPQTKTLGDVLRERVTTQKLPENEMAEETLSGLLHYGFSRTRSRHFPNFQADITNLLQGCGTAFDPFIAIYNVAGIEPGIYYYSVTTEFLLPVKLGNFRKDVYS